MKKNNWFPVVAAIIILLIGGWLFFLVFDTAVQPRATLTQTAPALATETDKQTGQTIGNQSSVLTGTQFPTQIPTATPEPLKPYNLETISLPAGLPNLNAAWSAQDIHTGADDVYFGNLATGMQHIVGGDQAKFSIKKGNLSGDYYFLSASSNEKTNLNRVNGGGNFVTIAEIPFAAHALWLSPDESIFLVTRTASDSEIETDLYQVVVSTGESQKLNIGAGLKDLVGWLNGQTVLLSNLHNTEASLVTYDVSQQAILSIQTSEEMKTYQNMLLSPDKQLVLLSNSKSVSVLNLADGSVRLLVDPTEVIYKCFWSTRGQTVIVELFGTTKIYEVTTLDGHAVEKLFNFLDPNKFYVYTKIDEAELLLAEGREDKQLFVISGDVPINQVNLTDAQISNFYSSEYWLP